MVRFADARAEDQQKINSFSKLNGRIKTIEEKMEALKASGLLVQCDMRLTHL